MLYFILRRLVSLLPVMLVISGVVFVAMRSIPGDPVDVLYGTEEGVTAETRLALEHKLGFDQPILVQYLLWLSRFVQGNWGISYFKGIPVLELVMQKLPWTFLLTISSMVFAISVSTPLGILAALKHNTKLDHSVLTLVFLGQSIPSFLLGIILILIFALGLRWLPSFGSVNPFENLSESLRHLLMPSITLGAGMTYALIRLIRSSIMEEMNKDYVRTARAKGVTEHKIVFKHVLRNTLIPIVTVIGLWFGFAMSGSVVVESIFAWPGIGQLLFQSILSRDYPIVQSIVLVASFVFVVINLAVDILYTTLDPRIQLST